MEPQRDWLEKDFYKVLGVSKTATTKDISKAYRKLARTYHPDTNQGDPKSEERFKEISTAYEVIGDEANRKKYDEFRRLGGGSSPFGGGRGPSGPGDLGDISDLLGGLFGGGRGGAGRGGFGGGGFGPMPGMDLQAGLTLSFHEAVQGVTKTVRLSSQALKAPMEVSVRIPPGVEDAQRIRVPGKGAPSTDGGDPGDLLVTISITDHPVFDRDGKHLLVTVPVTYSEAVLGSDIAVPLLNGKSVTVRIPPGTPSGKVLRVRGKGVQSSNGTGDLLVTIEVHVPENPSSEERELVERLRDIESPAPRSALGVS